jgi:hypothetical protein
MNIDFFIQQFRIGMAEVESAHDSLKCLKETILRVRTRTPAVGEESIQELWIKNIWSRLDITNNSEATTQYLYVIIREFVNFFSRCGFQRNVAKYFDNQGPFQLEQSIISGSWSEGLCVFFKSSAQIARPDVDFMCVLKNIKFTANDQICGNLTVRDDTPFINAYITDEISAKLWKDFLHDSCDHHSPNKHQLSSFKLKEKLRQNYSSVGNFFHSISDPLSQHYVHSEPGSAAFTVVNTSVPHTDFMSNLDEFCRSRSDFLQREIVKNLANLIYKFLPSSDIVLALSCDGWPLSAKEWFTRERIWPDKDLVKKITEDGFHIVPKCSPEGDFRLSFSSAETTLINHWSPLQLKVMRSFKAVVKFHQKTWSPNMKEIISTYHLKTIAFWYFEKTAQDSFTEETVATHLVLLLQDLAEALRKLELPLYFMPKVNLLNGIENYEEAIQIVEKIFHLSRDYAAIAHIVEKVAKVDLNKALKGILKKQLRKST